MAYVNCSCHIEARSLQNSFLPGRDQLTLRWTCACGNGEVSHAELQRHGSIVWPKAKPPAATALHQTHNTALLSAGISVWYKQPRRDIVGYMSYLALCCALSAPPSVKYNAFNSPAFCLGYFFPCVAETETSVFAHLGQRPKALSDIIPTIDQTLFTLTWFLSPPAIRRQPSTSCSSDQLYTFIFPLSGNFSCCGSALRSVGVY